MTETPVASSTALELRPFLLGAALLRHWRWTIGLPIWVAVLTTLAVLILPSQYTAQTTFLPQSRSDVRLPAGLASIAGQLGLPLSSGGTNSPKFYADLVASETIIDEILERPMDSALDVRRPPNLRGWLDIGGSTRQDSIFRAGRYLRKHLATDVDRETGVVSIRVTLPNPRVAATVAQNILTELDRFNADRRQSQARERRKFVEQRIAESERDLRDSEEALRHFYEANRQFQSSPALVFQERRLQARVALFNEVVLTLRREFESARIEEVNDTPVLTVIDRPQVPQRRSFPARRLAVISATLLSLVLGGVVAFFADFLAQAGDTDPDGRTAFLSAWEGLRTRVRHPFGLAHKTRV